MSKPSGSGPNCNPSNAHLFEAPSGLHVKPDDERRYHQANALCQTCPVIDWCRTTASEGFRHGELFLWVQKREGLARIRWRATENAVRSEAVPRTEPPRGQKLCRGCNAVKYVTEFGINRARRDGRKARCGSCDSEQLRKYRATQRNKRAQGAAA